MKSNKLRGAALAMSGSGLMLIVSASQNNIVEPPALVLIILSLTVIGIGVLIIIYTDYKK